MIKPSIIFWLVILIFSLNIDICYSQTPDPSPNSSHEKWEFVLEDTGDVLQMALPLTALTATIVKKDWKGTKQLALSYGTSILVTHSLKRIVRKERPEGRNLYDAFPSGHTTSAFSGASFIQRRYGWKYGKWAYLGAAVVGVSRMEGPDGWHDIWDVLAGATIGIGSTYIFTKPYQKQNVSVGFYSDRQNYVLSFKYKF